MGDAIRVALFFLALLLLFGCQSPSERARGEIKDYTLEDRTAIYAYTEGCVQGRIRVMLRDGVEFLSQKDIDAVIKECYFWAIERQGIKTINTNNL